MAGQEREPRKRNRGSKHQKQRARRNHTPTRNRPKFMYADEVRVFTRQEYDFVLARTLKEPKLVITTKGAFDESGNYYQED